MTLQKDLSYQAEHQQSCLFPLLSNQQIFQRLHHGQIVGRIGPFLTASKTMLLTSI